MKNGNHVWVLTIAYVAGIAVIFLVYFFATGGNATEPTPSPTSTYPLEEWVPEDDVTPSPTPSPSATYPLEEWVPEEEPGLPPAGN